MRDQKLHEQKNQTERRLIVSIITVILLALCLGISTFALVQVTISVENNVFTTGIIGIRIYNDQNVESGPIVTENDALIFEPGAVLIKSFYLKNTGSIDVYYRLYIEAKSDVLADDIQVTISLQDGCVLYQGLMSELTRKNATAAFDKDAGAYDILASGDRRDLTVSFKVLEGAGNDAQEQSLEFDLCVDATQVKNNDDREFEDETASVTP